MKTAPVLPKIRFRCVKTHMQKNRDVNRSVISKIGKCLGRKSINAKQNYTKHTIYLISPLSGLVLSNVQLSDSQTQQVSRQRRDVIKLLNHQKPQTETNWDDFTYK